MANGLKCDITVNKFQIHSHYNIHFQTNTLIKNMNLLIPSNYELKSTTTVFL